MKSFAKAWACMLVASAICAAQNSISIFEDSSYQNLRKCAQSCLLYGPHFTDGLVNGLDCLMSPYDACYCRADLSATASTFMSTCILRKCSYNADDYTSAFAAYTGYCDQAAGVAEATSAGSSTPTGNRPASGKKLPLHLSSVRIGTFEQP